MSWARALPWLLLLLGPFLLFPGAWLGDGVVSADDHLSVQPAFQETAGGDVRHPHLSDPAMQFGALRDRVVEALSEGEVPLWNADIYAGAPLLADGQSMVGSPVTWLRLLFSEDLAQDLGVAWILGWTGLGMGLLLRRMGIGDWPAALGGVAAMTGPYLHVWLLHPQAATYCWIPWLLWALEGRSLLSVALCTLGLLWGGHPGTAIHGLVLAGGWWTLRVRSGRILLGLVAGLLLSAPLVLPLLEQALRSTTASVRGGSVLEISQLQDLIWPGWQGHPARDSWTGTGSWADGQLHPGPATLVIGLLALGGPRRRQGRALWVAWGALLIISLVGLPGPFNHARLGSLGALLVAICAGLGAARLQGLGRSALAGLVAVVLFSGAWARESDQGILSSDEHHPPPAEWTQELAREVGCGDGDGDCARVLGLDWWLQPNTGSLVGLRDLRGYDLPVSQDTHRLMAALSSPPRSPWYPVDELPSMHLLRFAGVRAVLAPEQPLSMGTLEPLALGRAPVSAWRVPGEVPRAWVSPSASPAENPEAALRAISEQDLRARPPVEGLGTPLEGRGELHPVELQETSNSTRRLNVETDTAGLLVVSEAWAPGWRASMNGQEAPVLRVGGAFMGVRLDPGIHEVLLRYEPTGWLYGRWLGLVGLVVLGGGVWKSRRREQLESSTDLQTRG